MMPFASAPIGFANPMDSELSILNVVMSVPGTAGEETASAGETSAVPQMQSNNGAKW